MFEDQGNEGHENIVKAQALYRRMVHCGPDGTFKKIFAEAIQEHTLDEFYPVVVRAELTAALMICHRAADVPDFVFHEHLLAYCGLRPAQLINLPVQDMADISDILEGDAENIILSFGYKIIDGIIADHPDAHRKTDSLQDAAQKHTAQNAQGNTRHAG